MSLLIAVAGLLAAIYSVMPRERRLDLRLRLSLVDLLGAFLALGFMIYLEYYPFFLSHPLSSVRLALPLDEWPKNLDPTNLPDLVLLVSIIFITVRMRRGRLSRRNVARFSRLLDELYWAEGFEEIFNFLERHGKDLFRIQRKDYFLSRVYNWLSPADQFGQYLRALQDARSNSRTSRDGTEGWWRLHWKRLGTAIQGWSSSNLHWLRIILPNYEQSSEIAVDILNNVVLSDAFIIHLVRSRPYLGITLLKEWGLAPGRREFLSAYIWRLMEEPSSVFYSELRKNQILTSDDHYLLPGTNVFLHYFLSDATVAERSAPYKPIGDYVLMLLDELGQDPNTDPYNRALGYFTNDQWKSPLYACIRFFDVMVREALHQDIEWHMWLYYFPPIIEKMVRNYRVGDPFSDEDSEWPNRYAYLMSEMFSCLRDWVLDAGNLPVGQANIALERADASHENGNIPKSSIKALASALFYVLTAEHLGDSQQDRFTDRVFRLYFDLLDSQHFQDYALVVLACLRDVMRYRSTAGQYVAALMRGFFTERSEYRIKFGSSETDSLEAFLMGL